MIASKHVQFLVIFLGSILAIYVGSNIVALPTAGLIVVLSGLALIAWLFIAGSNWWVPIFTGGAIGGVFSIGFKVYPSEVACALAVVGLLPLVLVQDRKVFQGQRKPLPMIFFITGFYLLIRLLISILPASNSKGQLCRILFDFCWPFGFCFLFHHYGSFSAARTAMTLMFFLLLARVLAALAGFIFGIPLIVPGINYVLSFSSTDSLISMRTVAFMLLVSAMVLFHASKNFFVRGLLILVFVASIVLVLMGAGRFQTLVTLLLPIAFFAWSRKWVLLISAAMVGLGTIAVINLDPALLNYLPTTAGRSLSGLVFTENASQNQFATEGSDMWHASLRTEGYRRLTESPLNFLFGDGLTPSPLYSETMMAKLDPQKVIESAANIGAFENAFWTVMAITGVVGFALYTLLFIKLWEDTIPYFLKRPKGTFWEGFLFWGIFASVIWYVVSFFQGGAPSFELILMVLAWELVNEGKLDEEQVGAELAPAYAAPHSAPQILPVHSRG